MPPVVVYSVWQCVSWQ